MVSVDVHHHERRRERERDCNHLYRQAVLARCRSADRWCWRSQWWRSLQHMCRWQWNQTQPQWQTVHSHCWSQGPGRSTCLENNNTKHGNDGLVKKKKEKKKKRPSLRRNEHGKKFWIFPERSFFVFVLFLFFYSFLFVYHYKKSTELFYISWSQQWQNNSTRVVSGQKQKQLYSL